jgi:DNA-binding response OmpR family regulator
MDSNMAKVMVIDDDEDFTKLYKASLLAAGFEATAVNQSTAAIELAYLVKPDIFVIDIMMPDIDGFQLSRMIREDPVLRHIPIIIVTALTDLDSKMVAAGAGADDYLAKPFRMDDLKARIDALLGSAR